MTFWQRFQTEWLTAALLGLTVYIFYLLAIYPALTNNTLFRTLAQAIVISAFVSVASPHHYRVLQELSDKLASLKADNDNLRTRLQELEERA